MKRYLSDKKTHVDPCPHNGILLGLDSNDRDHCAIQVLNKIKHFCRPSDLGVQRGQSLPPIPPNLGRNRIKIF